MVQWDETSPRPYTRLNLIQGTKGILAGFPTRIALEEGFKNLSKDHHSWIQGENMKAIYLNFKKLKFILSGIILNLNIMQLSNF